MHDYTGFEEVASPDQLKLLHKMAAQLDKAKLEVARLEAELTEAKDRVRRLSEDELPAQMAILGMLDFRTEDGTQFKLREEVRMSFFAKDKSKREPAFDWLRANGHDGLIKNVVSASFGKGQDKIAEKFLEFAKTFETPVNVTAAKDIHHQTLLAFINEQRREGAPLPDLKLFGATIQKFVDVKRPK